MHSQGQGTLDSRCGETSADPVPGMALETTASAVARPLRRDFRGEPSQVPLVRDFVRRYLVGWPCSTDAVQDILLCVTELATNAVRHSRSGLPGGYFGVKIAICDEKCVGVAVEDAGGSWDNAPHEGLEGGRGLQIVSALSTDMGVTGSGTGRTVWFHSLRNPDTGD